jgi:hypothetical protein
MNLSRSFRYAHRVLNLGDLACAVRLALERVGLDPDIALFSVTEQLGDGTIAKDQRPLKDIERVCDPATTPIAYYSTGSPTSLYFALGSYEAGTYSLHIEAESAGHTELVRQTFEETLHLTPEPERDPATALGDAVMALVTEYLTPLQKRVEALEEFLRPRSRRLRCFLSYRFNDENDIVALRIQQFLGLLDVEVLSGANYEPRQVSEKVLSKLREPLDFIVLLITGAGESMWTRDEIGTAIHQGIGLVPVVEKGAKFDPGLFADVEYVEYDGGHVGDAFLKILQAVRFVREQQVSQQPLSPDKGSG